MRISDWSSDVCSSDLDGAGAFGRQLQTTRGRHRKPGRFGNDTAEAAMTKPLFEAAQERSLVASLDVDDPVGVETGQREGRREQVGLRHDDRKSVVKGQSVSVRVDPGGRRLIKQKI